MNSPVKKGIDEDVLRHSTGGDIQLMCEVLELFQEQASIWGRMLVAESEPRAWADACHTLKGAAFGIGAIALAEACTKAENGGRSNPAPSRAQTAVFLSDVKTQLTIAIEDSAQLRCTLDRTRKLS